MVVSTFVVSSSFALATPFVAFRGHGFWLGHDGLCNFCVQRRTRIFQMVGLSPFSRPFLLSFDLCQSLWVRRVVSLRARSGAVGAFGGVSCGWDTIDLEAH